MGYVALWQFVVSHYPVAFLGELDYFETLLLLAEDVVLIARCSVGSF